MKPTFFDRATVLAILALVLLGTACKKETPPEPEPEPEPTYNTETTLYVTEQNQVVIGETHYYCPDFYLTPPAPTPEYDINIYFTKKFKTEPEKQWIRNDTLFTKQLFTPTEIVDIDVILLTDYDNEYPKGSSISDQFDIKFSRNNLVDLQEFFRSGGTLDWNREKVCVLVARSFPDSQNNSAFLDSNNGLGAVVQLKLSDGTVLELPRPEVQLWF